MLKKFLILSLALLTLCGCRPINTKEEDQNKQYTIYSTKNIANTLFVDEYDNTLLLSLLSDEKLKEACINGESDLVIMPFNKAVELFKESKQYQIFAILSYKNYYLITSQERFAVGTAAAYGDKLMKGINSYLQKTDLKNYTFEYFLTYDAALEAFNNGEFKAIVSDDYYLLEDENYNEIADYEEIYQINSDYDGIPEYCLLVNNEVINKNQSQLVEFASTLKMLINDNLDNKDSFVEKIKEFGLNNCGFNNADEAALALQYAKLCFEYAYNQIDNMNFIVDLMGYEIDDALYVH